MTERQANASAKLKELQPTAQSHRITAHLFLPNRTKTLQQTLLRKTLITIKKMKVTCETVKFIDEIDIK